MKNNYKVTQKVNNYKIPTNTNVKGAVCGLGKIMALGLTLAGCSMNTTGYKFTNGGNKAQITRLYENPETKETGSSLIGTFTRNGNCYTANNPSTFVPGANEIQVCDDSRGRNIYSLFSNPQEVDNLPNFNSVATFPEKKENERTSTDEGSTDEGSTGGRGDASGGSNKGRT